jgi:formate dehydrogenase beta subunit
LGGSKNADKVKILTEKSEPKIASTKATKGGEFIWQKNKCTGCGRCAERCPVEAIIIDREKSVISKKVGIAPCTQACPAGVDASRYIRLTGEGKYAQAVAVLRERIPFPSVCAYVCLHPCESKCQRNHMDEHIEIRAMKRVAVANDDGSWKKNLKEVASTGKKVAVVGSGPAGLSTAYFLARKGHDVNVFEIMEDAGGKLLTSIPKYQLPKEILNAEIKVIEDIGVKINTNTKVQSTNHLFKEGYNAAVMTVGTHKDLKLPIPGIDKEGVIDGDEMLKNIAGGKEVEIGKKVVVLGGGDVAFKCVLAAMERGATNVRMFGMEHQSGKDPDPIDMDMALEQGVETQPWYTFVHVIDNKGKASGVESLKVRSFGLGKGGEVFYDTVEGTDQQWPADTVISAVKSVEFTDIHDKTLSICREGVFAAGDAVNEARSTIESIAAARWAASHMDEYLGGDGDITEVIAEPVEEEAVKPILDQRRRYAPRLPKKMVIDEQKGGEAEVELLLDNKKAKYEAKRCLKCDVGHPVENYIVKTPTCVYCGRCVDACYWEAITAGYGYEDAAQDYEQREKERTEKTGVSDLTMTILVIAVSVLILALVAAKALTI